MTIMAVSEEITSSEDKSPKRKNQQNLDNSVDGKRPKRRRDADQRILDQFWNICDPNPFKRNKSLKSIIEILIKQNETNNSNDLMYCLDRVIRGMASARQFARHGFCVLLTQILSIFKSKVSLDLIFELSEKHLGKFEDFTNHDSVIGWSLVMASLFKSQRLIEESDEQIHRKTFDVLYSLGINKPYIELVICELFNQFLVLMANKKQVFEKISLKTLREDIKTETKFKPFFVYISLSILEQFPTFALNKELKFIVKKDCLQKLAVMIRESTSYHPSVHPFNEQIIKYFMTKDEKEFANFWNQCIDFVCFSPNQSEKGFLGFELIKIGLKFIKTTENVSTILSPSFVRLFIQSLSVKTHPLHSASQELCEFFVNFIKTIEASDLQLEFVFCFTKPPGSLLFDDISKSKFFSNLLRSLNSISISKWTQRLKTMFLTTNKIDSNDILRIRCIQQFSNICKSLTSSDDLEILWSNVKFLFFHSYFDANESSQSIDETFKSPVVPINEKLRNSLKDGFRNTFNLLLHLESKTSKEKLTHEVHILSSMVEFINELISNDSIKGLTDENFLEPFNTCVQKVMRLKKKLISSPSKENEIKIFISLYSMLAIELFDESQEIPSIIPDLNECMKRAVNEESVKDNSGPVWSDVLVDLILSMLTKTSKLTKNVLFSCFKHICCHITNTGIQRLIDAINPSNDNKLFGGNEDSDDEEGEEEEENEEQNEKSESESDSESEDENPNTEIDEKFRNDVVNALGPAAHNDDDEESVYLSDSEMFQIDETLASVFKLKYSDKKESIEKRNSIMDFRIRCLELIQIFLSHKNISLDQTLIFVDPIVVVAKNMSQSSKQNQLSFKAIQLIHQIVKIKDSGDNSLDISDFKHILNNLMTIISKSIHSELQKALISLIIWIISLSKKLFPNNDWYYSDIETALKSFFEKNNCQTPPLFFKNLISVHNEIGFKLFDLFIEYGFNENIRPFVRSTSIEILLLLCKTQSSKTSVNSIEKNKLFSIRENCLKTLCTELSIENLRIQYVSELLKLFGWIDKNLTEQNPELKISDNDCQEISSKLKALSKRKRKNLSAKDVVKRFS